VEGVRLVGCAGVALRSVEIRTHRAMDGQRVDLRAEISGTGPELGPTRACRTERRLRAKVAERAPLPPCRTFANLAGSRRLGA